MSNQTSLKNYTAGDKTEDQYLFHEEDASYFCINDNKEKYAKISYFKSGKRENSPYIAVLQFGKGYGQNPNFTLTKEELERYLDAHNEIIRNFKKYSDLAESYNQQLEDPGSKRKKLSFEEFVKNKKNGNANKQSNQ